MSSSSSLVVVNNMISVHFTRMDKTSEHLQTTFPSCSNVVKCVWAFPRSCGSSDTFITRYWICRFRLRNSAHYPPALTPHWTNSHILSREALRWIHRGVGGACGRLATYPTGECCFFSDTLKKKKKRAFVGYKVNPALYVCFVLLQLRDAKEWNGTGRR